MAKGVRDSDQELFGNNLRIGPKEHSRLLLTTCKCERLQKISSEFGWALVVGKSDLEHVVSGKQQAWQDTACLNHRDRQVTHDHFARRYLWKYGERAQWHP